MNSHLVRFALVVACATALIAGMGLPAAADHTAPNGRLTAVPANPPSGEPAITRGAGTWEHVANFPGNLASDVKFFSKGGKRFASQGTLGQGPARGIHVGQRIVELLDANGELNPVFRADHGSAACNSPATSATGLQHDAFATPPDDPEILVDSTDAVGRCHDTPGGGLELIDISGIDQPDFEPREVHLIRFNGYSHTLTVDPDRPWLVFSNSSNFDGLNVLDFADIRSCLTQSNGGTLPNDADLAAKRAGCRPQVYRIPFETVWTQGTARLDGEPQGNPQACHDTVIEDGLLYCSAVHADLILDLTDLVDENGTPRGEPLDCGQPVAGTSTAAMVTDCALGGPAVQGTAAMDAWREAGAKQATGWKLFGYYNHVGRSDPTGTPGNSNTNTFVPANQGVAVSHETRPVPAAVSGDRRFMVTSDERGGGVIPGGASCSENNFDQYGHSGLHFLDITDPSNIRYAQMADEEGNTVMDANGQPARAFWRGDVVVPQGTFCVVHRFRFLEGEQRIIMGYYSQGVKILDYDIDEQGRFTFDEVASYTFKDSNTWTGDVFGHVDNPDGTRTYYIAASDTLQPVGNVSRGLDVLTWTADPNPIPGCPDPPVADYGDRGNVREAHGTSVDCVTERGIVRGFADNTFRPAVQVRRDQMASFIAQTIDAAVGAQGLPPASDSQDRFSDIAGNPHADNIKRLFAAGIIRGRSETAYAPGALVPRDQMATFLLRAAEYAAALESGSLSSDTQAFDDVPSTNTHFTSVNGAAEQGLVRGTGSGYQPARTIARDPKSSFVVNLLTAVEEDRLAAPAEEETASSSALGLGVAALLVLPSAALLGRRRRRADR